RRSSSAISEQVAAKPRPARTPRGRQDASTASRTASVTARQMSAEDCSTMSPGSRQIAIVRLALPRGRADLAALRVSQLPTLGDGTNEFDTKNAIRETSKNLEGGFVMRGGAKIGCIGDLLVELVCSTKNGRHRRLATYSGPFPSGAAGIFIDQAA